MSEHDELEILRMGVTQATHQPGGLEKRHEVLRKVLPPEEIKRLILQAIDAGWVHNGRIRWKLLLPHLPVQPHSILPWELVKIALGYYSPPDVFPEFRGAVWWWRVRLLYGIEDPVKWVVETWHANRIDQVVEYLGVADRKAAYFVMRKCRFALEARENFSEWLESLRSLDLDEIARKQDDDNRGEE